MSSHVSRDVCEGLAAAISEHQWTRAIPSIEAVFRRTPDYYLEDLGTLKVSVVPGPVQVNKATDRAPRGSDFFEVTLGIVLARHVGSDEQIGEMEDLAQAVIDAIRSYDVMPSGAPEATDWTDIALPMPFDPEALRDRNVFMCQIEVTYLVPLDKVS